MRGHRYEYVYLLYNIKIKNNLYHAIRIKQCSLVVRDDAAVCKAENSTSPLGVEASCEHQRWITTGRRSLVRYSQQPDMHNAHSLTNIVHASL